MSTEQLQVRHSELRQRLVMIREALRQTEEKAQNLHDQEQQVLGALAFAEEMIQTQPEQPSLLDNPAQ